MAQIGRDLEQFKECVVYYRFDYEIEVTKLEKQFTLWQEQLEVTEHVLLQGINALVTITPELKQAIIAGAKELKMNYIKCCQQPALAQFIDNTVQIKLAQDSKK